MTLRDPYSLGGWWRQQAWRGFKHVVLFVVTASFLIWAVFTHPRHFRHHYASPPAYGQQAPVQGRQF
jgi:4-amino-4-deoxy-L-arabinose transferase-like glycosyltransferase